MWEWEELAAPGERSAAKHACAWLAGAWMRMAGLLYFAQGLSSVTAGFEQEDLVPERDKLMRKGEAGDAAADDADGCAKEIASGCAAVELSEVDLHASGEACG